MTTPQDSPSENTRLERILAECLEAEDRGESLDEPALFLRYPEFAGELASFFNNRRAIGRIADRLRAQELSTTGVPASRDAGPSASLVGRTFGDYELTGEIARGGMGVVYSARHRTLQRTVALKMILAGRAASPADLARFKREAEAAARLDHPHIIPVYEVGEHDGFCYFTMKLLEGGNLHRYLETLKGDSRRAAQLVEQVARAVHFAHQRGVLHRDLKPANILLDQAGHPYVADFGLARILDSQHRMTETGIALGTPGYMAPEQIRGERSPTTAVDIYSLGAILFVCLTGRAPFQAEHPWDALQLALNSDPPSLRSTAPHVDRDLETICRKALDRDAARRYESAAAFADDLARWLRHEPIEARPPGVVQRIRNWIRRHPTRAVGAVATILAFVIGASQFRLVWLANERAESTLYRSLLAFAEREWMAGSTETAREALNGCPEVKRGWEWEYARRLCKITPANVWSDFSLPIVAGGYSANGRRISTIDIDGHAAVYDIMGQKLAQASIAVCNATAQTALSADAERWAIAGAQQLLVYDVATTEPRWGSEIMGDPLQIGFSPDGNHVVCLSRDRSDFENSLRLRIWSSDGVLRHDLPLGESYEYPGNWFCFAADGRVLVHPQIPRNESETEHGAPAVFDLESGERLGAKAPTESSTPDSPPWPPIRPAATSSDGYLLAYVYPDGRRRVEVLRVGDRRKVEFPVDPGHLLAYAFSPDGRMLAYALIELNFEFEAFGANKQAWILAVHVVELEKGKELCVLRGLPGNRVQLQFSPDSRRLLALGGAVAGSDRAIKNSFGVVAQWEVPARQTARMLQANETPIDDVAVTANGVYAIAGGDDCVLRVWKIATGCLVRELRGHTAPVKSIAAGNDPQKIVSAAGVEALEWNLETGESRLIGASGDNMLHAIAISPDGLHIALSRQNAIEQYRSSDMQFEWVLEEGRPQFPAYSRDGALLAIPYQFDLHGELKVVDTATGRVVHHFKSNSNGSLFRQGWGYLRAAFSPDGRFVAVVGNIGGVDLYDLRYGTLAHEMRGHGTTVWDVAFTADGTRLATTGYNDMTVKIWSTKTGEEMHTLRGHDEFVTGLAFTPDDARLITADHGGALRIWEARDPQPANAP